jgi:RNA polymerase sigma factor (sigma-70 family)
MQMRARVGAPLQYERMIYATAISVVKNPADAEEVCQEAVLKAFSNLSSFRAESKFSTWLVQITSNHIGRSQDEIEEGPSAPLRVD